MAFVLFKTALLYLTKNIPKRKKLILKFTSIVVYAIEEIGYFLQLSKIPV